MAADARDPGPTLVGLAESDVWFGALARVARTRPELFESLGIADFRLAVDVVHPDGVARYAVVLDGYDVEVTGPLSPASQFTPDAVLSGDVAAWRELLDNIAANGRADEAHTLNVLSIAGWPLALEAADPIGRDRFFRYAETLQQLFDGAGQELAPTVTGGGDR